MPILVVVTFFALLILGVPIFLVVLGSATVGIIVHGGVSPVILVQQLFNGLDRYIILAVPFFIMAGAIAAEGGVSRRIVNIMNVLFGRIQGGLGIATVFACAFFGAITGSSMATVVAIGSIMIPSLIRNGYPKSMAIGIVTTGGTLGVLIPPSIPMIILCVALQTSVGATFLAGFLPGLFIASCFSVYVWYVARKKKISVVQKYSFRETIRILKDSILALLFPIVVLGGIYGGITTPTEASAVALIYVLIVELFVYKKIKFKDVTRILYKSAVSSATLTLILACAIVFVWYVTTEQVPAMLYQFLTSIITAEWQLIIILLLLFLVIGCFMNVTEAALILGPMLIGTLTHFDVNLIHFIIMIVVMSQVGFITPPFGLCLFVAIQISGASMGEVVRASLPFLIILFLAGLVIAFIPQISTLLPNLFYG